MTLGAFLLTRTSKPASEPVPSKSYTTIAGQRATIRLADGTRVTLAPGTYLTVPTAFGTTTRTVALVGEAYFDVAHTHGAPFVVHTGKVETRVLGTTFDITRYASDSIARVVVTSGKVQTAAGTGSVRPPVVLTPGMVARVSDSTVTIQSVGDATAYTSWTDGRLEFRNVSVAEMLPVLERWYGMRFVVQDSTLSLAHVSASFDFERTDDALDYLKTLLAVRMTFDRLGDTTVVTLHTRNTRVESKKSRKSWPYSQYPKSEIGR